MDVDDFIQWVSAIFMTILGAEVCGFLGYAIYKIITMH